MPNLPAHIHLAVAAQERLGLRLLDDFRGPYYLGSTAPDMRMLLRARRESTHFAPLEFQRIGEGVEGLLREHPECAPSRTTGPTRAFVAGYLTHLVADEMWIVRVYRPYFGNRGVVPSEKRANLWDRAVQLDMDRRAWDVLADKEALRAVLATADKGINLSFVQADTLAEWRQIVIGFTERTVSFERLRNMIRRTYGEGDKEAMEMFETFLAGLPGSLDAIYNTVPRREVERFWQDTLDTVVESVGGYLAVERGARHS